MPRRSRFTMLRRAYAERDYDMGDWNDPAMLFAEPGGRSALRAASRRNPRNLPCPNCGAANRLTPADRAYIRAHHAEDIAAWIRRRNCDNSVITSTSSPNAPVRPGTPSVDSDPLPPGTQR